MITAAILNGIPRNWSRGELYLTGYDGAFRFIRSSSSIAINPVFGYVYNAELLPDRLRLVATAIPGQFLRDTQNDVVTFLDMMHRYLRFESIDDILRRLENSRHEETDKTLICS